MHVAHKHYFLELWGFNNCDFISPDCNIAYFFKNLRVAGKNRKVSDERGAGMPKDR